MRKPAAIAVAAVIALVLSACGAKSEDVNPTTEAFSVALDWYPNPDHAGLLVAQDAGYFEDAGLDVSLDAPSDPSLPIKLVAAGIPLILAVAGIAVGFASLHLIGLQMPMSVWSMNFSMMIGVSCTLSRSALPPASVSRPATSQTCHAAGTSAATAVMISGIFRVHTARPIISGTVNTPNGEDSAPIAA